MGRTRWLLVPPRCMPCASTCDPVRLPAIPCAYPRSRTCRCFRPPLQQYSIAISQASPTRDPACEHLGGIKEPPCQSTGVISCIFEGRREREVAREATCAGVVGSNTDQLPPYGPPIERAGA
jgi:hypothetical protein